ncbi:MAG: amidophosphoribosyltransferase, partial [bacterium]
ANQHNQNVDEIRKDLGVNSLAYLSLDKLLDSVPYKSEKTDYCTACFTKNYPIQIEGLEEMKKEQFDD